jgi:hypothetical protein
MKRTKQEPKDLKQRNQLSKDKREGRTRQKASVKQTNEKERGGRKKEKTGVKSTNQQPKDLTNTKQMKIGNIKKEGNP